MASPDPVSPRGIPEGTLFRCAAAPGLDEDDLQVALDGAQGGEVWGDGRPWPGPEPREAWSDDGERRRRHERLMRRWGGGVSPPVP